MLSYTGGMIGGPQGPKALLDSVRFAVEQGNLDTLSRLAKEFLSIEDNVHKCVDGNGNSITHLALEKNPSTLRFVLEELRGDANAVNYQGRTPLHEAVTKNYVECCQLLLENGADDSIQSATFSTPFHTAAACGSVECMELLLNHSEDPAAKVNELDKNNSSALHKCAFDGDVRVSRWLVERGAQVDACDLTDSTPLLVAVKMGQRDVVQYLLSQNANSCKTDNQGNSGVHLCAIRCDTAILKLLLDAGADATTQNEDYNNALHLSALHPRPDSKEWEHLIAMLLLAGCDPQQENASRKKPADYVARGVKKLFTLEEVQQREAQKTQAGREFEEDMERAIAQQSTWRSKIVCDIDARAALERREEDVIAKESEERMRAEEDVLTELEDVIETIRYREEEIEKKKALLNKASSKKSK